MKRERTTHEKGEREREGGQSKPRGKRISIWCLIAIDSLKPMKISHHSYIHCMCEVVKAAWKRKREREMKEARNMLTYTSEVRGGDAMGKRAQSFNISQQWFICSPNGNNSRMKHIHSPQNKLWLSILLMTWSPHVVNNRAKRSSPAAMAAIYYNIHTAADDLYLFYLQYSFVWMAVY